jgi:cysteine-rich repeat protein
MKNTNKTKMFVGTLLLGVILLSFASFVSAGTYLVYNDISKYSASYHVYDIPDSFVDYAQISMKGIDDKTQVAYMRFTYSNGVTVSTPSQNITYLLWTENKFKNPNPGLKVTSIAFQGGASVYTKDFFVYGSDSSEDIPKYYSEVVDGEIYCGNNIKEGEEECDKGELNGEVCNPLYGGSCTYCTNSCELKTIKGEYCGDGILNEAYERCDDGNTYDGDKCTSECKKPFEVRVEDFEPIIWGCDSRVAYDDGTEPGRITFKGEEMIERMNNYAFEGESIQWKVLVMDKNGIEKVKDVYVTVDGAMEANCKRLNDYTYFENNNDYTHEESVIINQNMIDPSCNARILEEKITEFNPETMVYYLCTLTVETPESMYGEADISVEAEDLDGVIGTIDEVEHWFLNPFIELYIEGELMFDEVRPGTSSYSEMILVGNDADDGSGVVLDMFVSGTDFYDSSSSGAKCPTTNQLGLENFAYYASKGAYNTHQDARSDEEGYVPVQYGIGFNDPKPFYNVNEIMQINKIGAYYTTNILSPGSEMSIIFRLNLPEPCNGDFTSGQIYFWGEAI